MLTEIARDSADASPVESVASSGPVPGTPKLPFDPPRRRSSLGFSKTFTAPATPAIESKPPNPDAQQIFETPFRQASNVGRKRTAAFWHSQASPGNVAYAQKMFQSAKATLQVDLQYASSPHGSIDSRLPTTSLANGKHEDDGPTAIHSADGESKIWRYSMVPSAMAAAPFEVREPMSEDSPLLPKLFNRLQGASTPVGEPASSGYASPETENPGRGTACLATSTESTSPRESEQPQSRDSAELERRMEELDVHNPTTSSSDDGRPNSHEISQENSSEEIVLPQFARAAADYARKKRGFVPGKSIEEQGLEDIHLPTRTDNQIQPTMVTQRALDGQKTGTTTPCPDPYAHIIPQTPSSMASYCIHPRTPLLSSELHDNAYLPSLTGPRVTARGSPMPFSRPHLQPLPSTSRVAQDQQQFSNRQVYLQGYQSQHASSTQSTRPLPSLANEHFYPGWYLARNGSRPPQAPLEETYSFSTAAAKACGESVAPDSRIRDSYRTDTLTPLARPPSRYRKNGIGAELRSRNPYLVTTARPLGHGISTRGNRTILDLPSYQCNDKLPYSSPQKPSSSHEHQAGRKRGRSRRAYTPEFDVPGDSIAALQQPSSNISFDSRRMRTDKDRINESPLAASSLHQLKDGMSELSPNVRVWRKGILNHAHARKKRRPSYWDDDLEEIRFSPASRGGIASSPVMSKRSMVAQVESASLDGVDSTVSAYEDHSSDGYDEPLSNHDNDENLSPAGIMDVDSNEAEENDIPDVQIVEPTDMSKNTT